MDCFTTAGNRDESARDYNCARQSINCQPWNNSHVTQKLRANDRQKFKLCFEAVILRL